MGQISAILLLHSHVSTKLIVTIRPFTACKLYVNLKNMLAVQLIVELPNFTLLLNSCCAVKCPKLNSSCQYLYVLYACETVVNFVIFVQKHNYTTILCFMNFHSFGFTNCWIYCLFEC